MGSDDDHVDIVLFRRRGDALDRVTGRPQNSDHAIPDRMQHMHRGQPVGNGRQDKARFGSPALL